MKVLPKFAILMTGTLREATFLCRLLPHVVGDHDFDLYLCIRQTRDGDVTRLSLPENRFSYDEIRPVLKDNVFLCVLPPYHRDLILQRYILPVGPDTLENEIHAISMFWGIFAGVKQIKASCRKYDYIVRTRTDYLLWDAPLFDVARRMYEETDGKVLVDAQRTCGFRYRDKPHLPWQGSISELFTFCSERRFFELWDFEERLPAIWTGVSETTFFRNALLVLAGDTVQHPRKNENFIQKYFFTIPGSFDQSDYYFRQDVLPAKVKWLLIEVIRESGLPPQKKLRLVWSAYRFFLSSDSAREPEVLGVLREFKSPATGELRRELVK